MLAPLLKHLREKVKRLPLGSLTNGLCTAPEASAQLLPQLLAISQHPFVMWHKGSMTAPQNVMQTQSLGHHHPRVQPPRTYAA